MSGGRLHCVAIALLGSALAVWASGCASPAKPGPSRASSAAARPASAGVDSSGRLIDPIDNPKGFSRSDMAQSALLPLGTLPYDNMALPLVSPDGRHVATQAGIAPTWATAMAARDAETPRETRIEIYRLDRREGIQPEDRKSPELLATLNEPALLGRSCDAEGFLIESPRPDGSRWIGRAAWTTGEIEWLVNDANVNAFASLGPAGRLAWCRRTVAARQFELVVRDSGGETWSLPVLNGEEWLMPLWSGRGDGLFVFHLQNGDLEARFGVAASASTFRQSLQRHKLVEQATAFAAYQALNSQPNLVSVSETVRDQLIYFHPRLGRVALWRPTAPAGKKAMHLNAGSISALLSEDEFAIVCTAEQLLRQSLQFESRRVRLMAGTQVPRATPGSAWPMVVLAPGEGRIGLTALRLLPVN